MELRDIDVNEPAEAPAPSPEITEEPAEQPVEATPKPAEEPAKEPAEEPAKIQPEVKEPAQEPEQPKGRSRAEERIRNLARENAELKAAMQNFQNRQSPELNKDEISSEDLNKVINERALQAAELMIASQQVNTQYQQQVQNWATDFEQVKKENPQLDPQSPEYDVELDATLARLLDDGTGQNTPRTDILVSDVLKTLRKQNAKAASTAKEEGKAEVTAKLAKQVAEGAITPTAKAPSESVTYTDEELAEMRVKDPKKYMKMLDQM